MAVTRGGNCISTKMTGQKCGGKVFKAKGIKTSNGMWRDKSSIKPYTIKDFNEFAKKCDIA